MKVGMLTGGGDCPGLNAVLRAAVRKATVHYGDELVGFRDGWKGVVENLTIGLDIERMRGTLPRGGTVLGSSRTNPYKIDGGVDGVKKTLADHGVDALIAIGGEDTLGVASRLHDEGIAVVDAIDRLHTTAESHDRVMVVEVMGRHAGHIALWSGIAGGATMVLIPEEPFDLDEVCAAIVHRHENKNRFASIVVVAEGAVPKDGTFSTSTGEVDAFGHARLGGIGDALAKEIESRTGYESRAVVLGHIQRGGTPTAFDRVLSTRFGIAAIDAVHDNDFGTMVALRCGSVVRVPLSEATGELKLVDPELYDVAKVFFG